MNTGEPDAGKLACPVREKADGKGPEPRAPRRRPISLCERRGVRFLPATLLVILVHGSREDTEALREDVARTLVPMGLRLSPAKTQVAMPLS